ncbi:hypothetical protein HYPSUDRAFT_226705 [Hypholoma sublateritium FD-334 SS-4]|uniref:Uncharacterized protein n=1 Tax=Hypholoma sublateritium (strain FD-334 SS-4) TaxID=945553 RepID=A0A0D2QDI0_HYPSF|nr:hypothetical protein HYPSUDRAFT_226705 [Hypholoma sublateritium FD-334 SS-4]
MLAGPVSGKNPWSIGLTRTQAVIRVVSAYRRLTLTMHINSHACFIHGAIHLFSELLSKKGKHPFLEPSSEFLKHEKHPCFGQSICFQRQKAQYSLSAPSSPCRCSSQRSGLSCPPLVPSNKGVGEM